MCLPKCRSQARTDRKGADQLPVSAALAGVLAPFLLDVDPALAGNPLLTGKTVSLVHPVIMIFLFGSTAWTGWLGWQWRSVQLFLSTLVSDVIHVCLSAVTSDDCIDLVLSFKY